MKREARIQMMPHRFDGKQWHHKPRLIVLLGDVGRWSMVRHAEYPGAVPFVISRKEWDKLEVAAINPEAGG